MRNMRKRHREVKEHPQVGRITKAMESHILSQFLGHWLCKGRPIWWEQGGGTMDNGVLRTGLWDPPQTLLCVFSLGPRTPSSPN